MNIHSNFSLLGCIWEVIFGAGFILLFGCCRLFQLNTDIFPKKFYQLINSLSWNIFPPWMSLIELGQVGFYLELFGICFYFAHPFLLGTFFWSLGCDFWYSCLLPVRSITGYCDNQRRTPQFSSLHYSALCGIRWYFCFNRFVSYPFLTVILKFPICHSHMIKQQLFL